MYPSIFIAVFLHFTPAKHHAYYILSIFPVATRLNRLTLQNENC